MFQSACDAVAESISLEGFRYTRSKKTLSKESELFIYGISFESSHRNEAETYVELRIAATVESPALSLWRAQQDHPLRTSARVAGALLGALCSPPRNLHWNLASRSRRHDRLKDAARAVRDIALPYFAEFDDLPTLLEKLCDTDLPGLMIGDAIELAICFQGKAKAELIASNYLCRNRKLRDPFQERRVEYENAGLPAYFPTQWSDQLAFVAAAQGLSIGG